MDCQALQERAKSAMLFNGAGKEMQLCGKRAQAIEATAVRPTGLLKRLDRVANL
jgi:hypothetical protein